LPDFGLFLLSVCVLFFEYFPLSQREREFIKEYFEKITERFERFLAIFSLTERVKIKKISKENIE
jgi:hypothetical protein